MNNKTKQKEQRSVDSLQEKTQVLYLLWYIPLGY